MIRYTSGDLLLSGAKAIAHGVAPNDPFNQGLAHALRELFATLSRTGTTADALPRLASFGEFNELVGLSAQRRREADLQDYADALVARHANH